MKEKYGIFLQTIMAETIDARLSKEFLFRRYISKNQTEGLDNYIGRESYHRFRQLFYRAVSVEIISMRKITNLSN
jgi:hypothetical protein